VKKSKWWWKVGLGMARPLLKLEKRLYKISIQSKPLYNIIERFAKISI
jgi:hypothetical protein